MLSHTVGEMAYVTGGRAQPSSGLFWYCGCVKSAPRLRFFEGLGSYAILNSNVSLSTSDQSKGSSSPGAFVSGNDDR